MRTYALHFGRFVLVIATFMGFALGQVQRPTDDWDEESYKTLKSSIPLHPKDGFVPDESTATTVAEAVTSAQYGEKQISEEKPFRARLRGDIWTVAGTLHPQGVLGGVVVVQISKKSGAIVFMTHQK
jgi:hypothetical protein